MPGPALLPADRRSGGRRPQRSDSHGRFRRSLRVSPGFVRAPTGRPGSVRARGPGQGVGDPRSGWRRRATRFRHRGRQRSGAPGEHHAGDRRIGEHEGRSHQGGCRGGCRLCRCHATRRYSGHRGFQRAVPDPAGSDRGQGGSQGFPGRPETLRRTRLFTTDSSRPSARSGPPRRGLAT